jgi:hypothetical protein
MKYSLRSLMRFSLRDLFWFTVVVAMGVAWWMDRSKLEARLKPFSWLEEMITHESRYIEAPAPNPPKP